MRFWQKYEAWRWVILLAILGLPGGYAWGKEKVFLLHLNGVGGEKNVDRMLVAGLAAGGFEAEVTMYDWTRGQEGLAALQAYEENQKESEKVANLILAQHKANPGQPIYVTCHSGGVGIAVWALERLPEDVRIEAMVMVAPALSPAYDLSRALRHVRGKVYVFTSPLDKYVLSAGTRMFGTIDRKYCDAAGLGGFVRPEGADATEYEKLSPQPYQREWFGKYGSMGNHISAMGTKFAWMYVAPLLLTGRPPGEAATASGPGRKGAGVQ